MDVKNGAPRFDTFATEGSISTHTVVNIQDTNGLGQLLVPGRDVDDLPTTLLVSPQ